MNAPRDAGTPLLAQVQPGLVVYDAAGERLGTVRRVEFGAGEPAADRQQAREAIADVREATRDNADRPGTGNIAAVGVGGLSGDGGHPIGPLTSATPDDADTPREGLLEGILGAFRDDDTNDDVPEALARRGFIEIDGGGFFDTARYATPDQIAAVHDGAVRLTVPASRLTSAE